jgi:hypothetical protein
MTHSVIQQKSVENYQHIATFSLNTFIYITPHFQRTITKCVLREHLDLHLKLWGIQNKDI